MLCKSENNSTECIYLICLKNVLILDIIWQKKQLKYWHKRMIISFSCISCLSFFVCQITSHFSWSFAYVPRHKYSLRLINVWIEWKWNINSSWQFEWSRESRVQPNRQSTMKLMWWKIFIITKNDAYPQEEIAFQI